VAGNQQQQPGASGASITSLLKQDGVMISFNLDKDNKFVFKLINPLTNEVIRQIPPEEFASLTSSIQQTAGILVDKQA
jgi:flagellar protein FlaG